MSIKKNNAMGISPAVFYDAFVRSGVSFFTGVPDSLLKNFCAYVQDHSASNHIITANEGGAMAMAMGHYLASKKPSLVYLQNSGLGNVINPLLSMADADVYAIPMVLLIGWRGEVLQDGTLIKDEPQHKKQGKVTLNLLEAMGLQYEVIDEHTRDIDALVANAIKKTVETQAPFCLVARKNTFAPYTLKNTIEPEDYMMSRATCVQILVAFLQKDQFVVSTTGMASRELFEAREKQGEGHNNDFLVVGAMGHASQMAAGILQADRSKKVYCLDGDGAVLMHMGALPINKNYPIKHIVINNGVHDSVGGQPTVAREIDLVAIAKAGGYESVDRVVREGDLKDALQRLRSARGAALLEVVVRPGTYKGLGRPTLTSLEIKECFQRALSSAK